MTATQTTDLPLWMAATAEPQRHAHRLAQRTAGGQQHRVMGYLRDRGAAGATDEQIQAALGLRTSSETARRHELVAAGLVQDSGRRQMSSGGRLVTVWVIVDAGGLAE